MGFGFDSIKKKKKRKLRDGSRSKGTRISNESSRLLRYFSGLGILNVLFDAYTVSNCQRFKRVPWQGCFSRSLFAFNVSKTENATKEKFGAKENLEARKESEKGEREKERGIFVIRKSKLRPSRTIAVARVIFDLTLFPSLILTLVPPQLPVPNIFHHGKLDFTPLCMRAILQWRSN